MTDDEGRYLDLRVPGWLSSFAGFGSEARWPSWLFLRALGLAYALFFAGYCLQAEALFGAQGAISAHRGILPAFAGLPAAFVDGAGPFLAALGLAAAVAVMVDAASRLALGACLVLQLALLVLGPKFFLPELDLPLFWLAGVALALPSRAALVALRLAALVLIAQAGLSGHLHALSQAGVGSLFPTALDRWLGSLPEPPVKAIVGLALPVCALISARVRPLAAAVWLLFEAVSAASARSGWLNVLGLGAGLILLDDGALAAIGFFGTRKAPETAARGPKRLGAAALIAGVSAVAALVFVSSHDAWQSCPEPKPGFLHLEAGGGNFENTAWRNVPFSGLPQLNEGACALFLPCFSRFEAVLERAALCGDTEFVHWVGSALLLGRVPVRAQFAADPSVFDNPARAFLRFPVETLSRSGPGGAWHRTATRNASLPLERVTGTGTIRVVGIYNGNSLKPAD